MTAPTFNFNVSVDTSTGAYDITDSNGSPANEPIDVTEPNTVIIYTLSEDSGSLVFTTPEITGDDAGDLTWELKDNDKTLEIVDSDADSETICLKLVTQLGTTTFVSPDPQIKNEPK